MNSGAEGTLGAPSSPPTTRSQARCSGDRGVSYNCESRAASREESRGVASASASTSVRACMHAWYEYARECVGEGEGEGGQQWCHAAAALPSPTQSVTISLTLSLTLPLSLAAALPSPTQSLTLSLSLSLSLSLTKFLTGSSSSSNITSVDGCSARLGSGVLSTVRSACRAVVAVSVGGQCRGSVSGGLICATHCTTQYVTVA